jgi:hypothetical protein
MNFEAKHYGKLDLALQMIQRPFYPGIRAGYVLFDSWYAWPAFIKAIRRISCPFVSLEFLSESLG